MKPLLLKASLVGLAVCALAIFLQVRPNWLARPTLTASESSADSPIPIGHPRAPVLRLVARQQIAQQVIDGRYNLLEAASMYHALNQVAPAVKPFPVDQSTFPVQIPVDSDEGILCVHVISCVHSILQHDSARAANVLFALERQFHEALYLHGSIRLPEPSTLPRVAELLATAEKGLR